MALARTGNQLLKSQGNDTTTVATNYPITGDGSTQLPLGLAEDYRGADGTSVTFEISAIPSGHRVTLSGAQGQESFDVMNGATGPRGETGPSGAQGPEGPQGPSGAQGPAGQDGVDGVSPTFRFVENEDGVTVIVSGAQGEDSFTLYNATGEGASYSAGSFIDIYDVDGQKYISANVSAGTPWLSGWKEIGALSLNFGDSVQIVSSHDFSGFHNHAIGLKGAVVTLPSTAHIGSALDDKLDASAFSNFISTEYSTAKSDIYNSASYLMQTKLDKSASGNFYPMTGNPSGFLTAHQDITNLDYVQNSALDYTPSMFISGISGHELYAESANHAFTAETANYVEGGWEYDSNNNISSYNGSAFVGQGGGGVDPSALSGYIPKSAAQTDEANVHYNYLTRSTSWMKDTVSVYNTVYTETTSFDTEWHNYTLELSNAKVSTACPILISITSDVTANAIGLTGCDDSYSPVTDRYTWFAYPTDNTKLVFTAELQNADIVSPTMTITKLQIAQPTGGSDFTISLTGSNNDVLATRNYVDNAVSTAGKTYTGVAPIVVNNDEDKISANCIELSAGNGIDSNKLATGVIEVSSQGGGNFSSSAFGINQSQQVTALTSLSYYDTGVGNSNQLSGNSTNNLGWTMPSAYANVKSDVIADADAQVQSRYSYKLSYSTPTTGFTGNSGLEIRKYVGNSVTTRKVLSGNSTIGELVPDDYNSRQYLTTNAAGNMVWDNIVDSAPVVLVATSGDIPASGSSDGKVYIVTGNS